MKKTLVIISLVCLPFSSRADFWGGDLPLLAQIVTNTMNTLMQLQQQTRLLEDEMDGIKDKIDRIRTIANVVQPSTWDKWKDPAEALRRMQTIYHTMPKEYHSAKYDAIEDELSKAMNMISRVSSGAQTSFESGKELERRGADSSPGVAQKLTASGVGTLISMESQSLVIQSHVTSLLSQMLAESNERETRSIVAKGTSFSTFSKLNDRKFSSHVQALRMSP